LFTFNFKIEYGIDFSYRGYTPSTTLLSTCNFWSLFY